nr:HNH endonuclease [Paenibacillus camelliae]
MRRTGRRERPDSRRGTCKQCRQAGTSAGQYIDESKWSLALQLTPSRARWNRKKRQPLLYHRQPDSNGLHADDLRPTWRGVVRMRGRSDTGRRWIQEVDPAQAKLLVKEGAAVIINPYTIRMIYSSKEFRRFILARDHHTCHYCGEYGDTIDHLVPRAKGGHTTPVNCVCACLTCNQQKGNLTPEQFMQYLLNHQKEHSPT